jgi:hypothetical protein
MPRCEACPFEVRQKLTQAQAADTRASIASAGCYTSGNLFAAGFSQAAQGSMNLGVGLRGGLAAMGLDLSDAQQARLLAFIALLAKWNRTYNLTAIRQEG